MIELLRQVVAEIEKLPEHEQNAIAARFLAELKEEEAWANRFASTTDDQWDNLARMVRTEIADGEIFPLDDVFPK